MSFTSSLVMYEQWITIEAGYKSYVDRVNLPSFYSLFSRRLKSAFMINFFVLFVVGVVVVKILLHFHYHQIYTWSSIPYYSKKYKINLHIFRTNIVHVPVYGTKYGTSYGTILWYSLIWVYDCNRIRTFTLTSFTLYIFNLVC